MQDAFFKPPPPETPFEQAAGRPMVFTLQGSSSGTNPATASIGNMAHIFEQLIPDATQAVATREGQWAAWRGYLSYLFVHNCLLEAIPASRQALQGFLLQLIMCGYSGVAIERFITAIKNRHKHYNCSLPIHPQTFSDWGKAIVKQLGMPKREKWTIMACHLRKILFLPRTSLKMLRDLAVMAVGTVCALRPSEIMRLQLCDLLFDIDGPGTLALLLWVRKNDGNKSGLWPRILKGTVPETCIILLLKAYIAAAKLVVHPECSKGRWRRAPCAHCGPLFRATDRGGTQVRPADHPNAGMSRDMISKAVRGLLEMIGVESLQYTPVSMRRGGISTALAAGVDEGLRKLQAGQKSVIWTDYADVLQRDQLYNFCRSFGF